MLLRMQKKQQISANSGSDSKTCDSKTCDKKTCDSKTCDKKTCDKKTCDSKTCDNTINFITSKDFQKTSQDLIKKMIRKKAKSSESLVASKEALQKTIDANNKIFDFKRSPLNRGSLSIADFKKQRAIAKLKSGSVSIQKKDPNNVLLQRIKLMKDNEKLKEKIRRKIEEDQKKDEEDDTKEQMQDTPVTSVLSVLMSDGKMSREEFNEILKASSSHTDTLNEAEIERQEKYFNPKIKKEMMEMKMSETFEVNSKVVTCHTCDYTFWGPHERCKTLAHRLSWRDCKKQFWECSNCQQRTTTWQPYPTKSCWGCGSSNTWRKTSMLIPKKGKKLESEILLIRGIEHSKFLNSIK